MVNFAERFRFDGLQRAVHQVGVAAVIGGGGQVFFDDGTFAKATAMIAIGVVLVLIGNLQLGQP